MIYLNEREVSSWKFPGGEVGCIVEDIFDYNTISAYIESSDDVMLLALMKNAIEENPHFDPVETQIHLILKYLPYAQQDRVCNKGESLSIKVFANIINAMNFSSVTVWDCHSDVGVALLDRCLHVPVWELWRQFMQGNPFHEWTALKNQIKMGKKLIAPDAGANKKLFNICKLLEIDDFIRADKVRNTSTGEITDTRIYADNSIIKNQDFLIIDDICVGGGTFIPLAHKLKLAGARSVSLYVTHGVFSRGVRYLIDNGIDWIYTTTSRLHDDTVKQHKNVTILSDYKGGV